MQWDRISVGVCSMSCLVLSTPAYIRQPLGSLVSVGMVRFQEGRGQKVALNQPEARVSHHYHNGQQGHNDSWGCHGVPEDKIDGQQTKILLDLHNRKRLKVDEQKADVSYANAKSLSLTQFPDQS